MSIKAHEFQPRFCFSPEAKEFVPFREIVRKTFAKLKEKLKLHEKVEDELEEKLHEKER